MATHLTQHFAPTWDPILFLFAALMLVAPAAAAADATPETSSPAVAGSSPPPGPQTCQEPERAAQKRPPAESQSAQVAAPKESASDSNAAQLREKWGVEVTSLRLTSNGYMLDFRFRVLDTEKSKPLFDPKTKPYLIDLETGAKFLVPTPPKIGALRTSRVPKTGAITFIFFANPGKYIAAGKKVTVVIGDFRAENLVVE